MAPERSVRLGGGGRPRRGARRSPSAGLRRRSGRRATAAVPGAAPHRGRQGRRARRGEAAPGRVRRRGAGRVPRRPARRRGRSRDRDRRLRAPARSPRPRSGTPRSPPTPRSTAVGAWVAELRRQLATTNPWINTTTYSTPVYTVPAGQPTVRVKLDTTSAPLQQAFEQVPIPAGAEPAAGGDAHMVVWQPATDTMWEFWLASQKADGWHARWGGRMTGVSRNPGYFTAPNPGWGATATSLPLLGGLMRTTELQAGRIDHALAFAIPHTKLWKSWSWPAQRSDGDTDSADAIPEGARFRLPANLDIDALKLPPVTAAIAKAVQRYGMVLRDKSGAVSFYAEAPTGADPYPALFKTLPEPAVREVPLGPPAGAAHRHARPGHRELRSGSSRDPLGDEGGRARPRTAAQQRARAGARPRAAGRAARAAGRARRRRGRPPPAARRARSQSRRPANRARRPAVHQRALRVGVEDLGVGGLHRECRRPRPGRRAGGRRR